MESGNCSTPLFLWAGAVRHNRFGFTIGASGNLRKCGHSVERLQAHLPIAGPIRAPGGTCSTYTCHDVSAHVGHEQIGIISVPNGWPMLDPSDWGIEATRRCRSSNDHPEFLLAKCKGVDGDLES